MYYGISTEQWMSRSRYWGCHSGKAVVRNEKFVRVDLTLCCWVRIKNPIFTSLTGREMFLSRPYRLKYYIMDMTFYKIVKYWVYSTRYLVGTSQLANPGHKGSAAPEFTHYRLIVHIVVYRQRGFVPLHHFHRKFARDIFSPRCILSLYPYCVSSTRSRTLGWQLWVIE